MLRLLLSDAHTFTPRGPDEVAPADGGRADELLQLSSNLHEPDMTQELLDSLLQLSGNGAGCSVDATEHELRRQATSAASRSAPVHRQSAARCHRAAATAPPHPTPHCGRRWFCSRASRC